MTTTDKLRAIVEQFKLLGPPPRQISHIKASRRTIDLICDEAPPELFDGLRVEIEEYIEYPRYAIVYTDGSIQLSGSSVVIEDPLRELFKRPPTTNSRS